MNTSKVLVGLVCLHDPSDPGSRSGVTYSTHQALVGAGLEVVPLVAEPSEPGGVETGLASRAIRAARRRLQSLARRFPDPLAYRRTIELARRRTRTIQRQLEGKALDALVCVNASSALFHLRTDLPLVYSTDATALLLTRTYPSWAHRPAGFKQAWNELEEHALSRIAFAALPSARTIDSAVRDYGVPAEKLRLVPRGANVRPPSDSVAPRDPRELPLQLTVVGKDPVRKRVGFCIEVAQRLKSEGVDVCLNFIGKEYERARRSPLVRFHGLLDLGRPEHRALHQEVLSSTHFFLLPSLGEMYGIAAVEAAHFACPSLVSDVGGLSTIVQHGRTGLVFPPDATAEEYAAAILDLRADPAAYREMALRAQARAREELTWESWGASVAELVREAVGSGRTERDRTQR